MTMLTLIYLFLGVSPHMIEHARVFWGCIIANIALVHAVELLCPRVFIIGNSVNGGLLVVYNLLLWPLRRGFLKFIICWHTISIMDPKLIRVVLFGGIFKLSFFQLTLRHLLTSKFCPPWRAGACVVQQYLAKVLLLTCPLTLSIQLKLKLTILWLFLIQIFFEYFSTFGLAFNKLISDAEIGEIFYLWLILRDRLISVKLIQPWEAE